MRGIAKEGILIHAEVMLLLHVLERTDDIQSWIEEKVAPKNGKL